MTHLVAHFHSSVVHSVPDCGIGKLLAPTHHCFIISALVLDQGFFVPAERTSL